ncbi:hypothetical protein D3C84_1106340 [compost metagenome]
MQHAWQRLDPDDSLQLVAERPGVDLDGEAADHPALLQAAHPLGDAGRGQADPARQFLQGHPRVLQQRLEDVLVDLVDHFSFLRE